jgi:hypothetical protein
MENMCEQTSSVRREPTEGVRRKSTKAGIIMSQERATKIKTDSGNFHTQAQISISFFKNFFG